MSYVREDDANEDGRLTELCERLSGEVAAQWGEPFPIFQDRRDIAWGQQWQERLDESLDSVTFLIPIVTPRFFRSRACRAELERFLKRERELGRCDLILPVYYIHAAVLDDAARRSGDTLAEIIHSRQYWDWRPLRFKPLTSEQVGETIAGMAAKIIVALDRPAAARPAPTPLLASRPAQHPASLSQVSEPAPQSVEPSPPPLTNSSSRETSEPERGPARLAIPSEGVNITNNITINIIVRTSS
jgi:TIR domain